jgi:hypothetical protein
MAARRERDRRRPTGERRYSFTVPEAEDTLVDGDESAETTATVPVASTPSTRGGVRPGAKPFSAYKEEYAYVGRDLRRVAAVIGGLLIALIILYFLLPILIH